MENDFPLGLRRALESGDCVLFVGAGIGFYINGLDGKHLPDAATLAKEMADYFSVEIGETRNLAKISQYIEIKKGRPELEAYLKKRFSDLTPDENVIWLSSLRWRAIFTTNYDL